LERAPPGATASVVRDDDDETPGASWTMAAQVAFEAIGLQRTVDLCSSVRCGLADRRVGGDDAVRRGGSFDAYDLVDRSLRILGSNYGSRSARSIPRYAELHLAGRL
jgi:hypothetical protein